MFVVDDDQLYLHVISTYLRSLDLDTVPLLNGESVFELIESRRPDLILLDVNMQGIDGYQVCSRLKAAEAYRDIPVIFLSGLVNSKFKVHGFEVGAVDFISKPIQEAELQARVKIHLELAAVKKQLETSNLQLQKKVAQHKHTLEKLKKSEEKFRAIADFTYAAESWHGPNGKLLWANPAVERVTGYSAEECMAHSDYPWSLFAAEDKERLTQDFRQAMEDRTSGDDLEWRLKRKDGSEIWVSASWQPIYDQAGRYLGIRSSVREVSQRKGMEMALKDTLASLTKAQALAHLGSWEWDIGTGHESWSDECFRIFGYEPGSIRPEHKVFTDAVHPDDLPMVDQAHQATLTEEADYSLEYRIHRPDGSQRFVHSQAEVFKDADGQPVRLIGTVLDITDRKRAEEISLESRLKYELLFQSISDGVCVHRLLYDGSGQPRDYQIIEANPAYETITGIPLGRAIGAFASELYGPGEPPYLEVYAQVAETGRSTRFEDYFPSMDRQLKISVYSPERGRFVTFFEDITQRKRSEESLREQIHQPDNT